MDDSCVSQLAAIATTIVVIMLIVAWILSGVQSAINQATSFLEDIWAQLNQVVQQIKEFFQNLFTEIALPDIDWENINRVIQQIIDFLRNLFNNTDHDDNDERLTVGQQAIVNNTAGQGLRCRENPNTSSTIVVKLAEGTVVNVISGPASQDGFDWWQVEPPSQTSCWAAGDWLIPLSTLGTASIAGKVTDGHNLPLAGVFVELLDIASDRLVITTTTKIDGSYSFKDVEQEKTYRVRVNLRDGSNTKRILWGKPGRLVNVRTEPFYFSPAEMLLIIDIDFADLKLDSEPIPVELLDDLASIYFHTQQVEDFAINTLGLKDHPELKYHPPKEIYAFWKPESGCGSVWYDSEALSITIDDNSSSWDYWGRPMNREWHENFHHLMNVVMPGTLEKIGNQYEEFEDSNNNCDYDSGEKLTENEYTNENGIYDFGNHRGFSNWNSGDSWVEGWAEFWPCVLVAERTSKGRNICFYKWLNGLTSMEYNWLVWSGTPGPADNPDDPAGDTRVSREELAVASLLWDLYDPISHSDNDDVDLSLDNLWRIIGRPTENNDLSDMKYVYDAFKDALPTLSNEDDGRPITQTSLDQIFVNHGFFEDLNGNQKHDTGEQIGWAGSYNRR